MLHIFKTKGELLKATLLCLGSLSACQSEQPENLATADHSNVEEAKPPLPIVEAPFNRARLLFTVARAASSHSAGADDTDVQRTLDGKRFEVRLRFGCNGQGPGHGDHGWSVDPDGRTLRVRVVPTLSLNDDVVRGLASVETEAAGGFWLPRPWLLNATCPRAQPDATSENGSASKAGDDSAQVPTRSDQPGPVPQRIGIVQFFTPDDSRTGRRMDQPFEAVKQLKEGDRIAERGYNLVLAGRLRARGDGRVILCTGNGQDRPPDCVVSADIDRLWIEQPDNKGVVAEWSV